MQGNSEDHQSLQDSSSGEQERQFNNPSRAERRRGEDDVKLVNVHVSCRESRSTVQTVYSLRASPPADAETRPSSSSVPRPGLLWRVV